MSLTIHVPFISDAFIFIASLDFRFAILISLDELDSLNDESYNDGSDSGPPSMYSFTAFSLCFDNSVVHVSGLGSGVFVPIGVDSKCDILRLSCLYQLELNPKVVDS